MTLKLLLSNSKGDIFVHPTLKMAAFNGRDLCLPKEKEVMASPKGSTLFYLPHHAAVGWNEKDNEFVRVEEFRGRRVFPAAAFLTPGFTRLHLPAAQKLDETVILPLWPYTAVGWRRGKFYVCAVKIDTIRRQMPFYYAQKKLLEKNIGGFSKKFPENRLVRHLAFCALKYNCRNAQNLFLKRWEAPLPISPACNAKCLGCLSFQESDCGVASHQRISFVPTPQEVAEVALAHLRGASRAMISFGQGCEGEPLLQFAVLKESISLIRKNTRSGTVHLNTNGSQPLSIKELAKVGLDSVRISINSLDPAIYKAYFRPRGYHLSDVLAAVAQAKKSGLFVSLNFLTFPGFSDDEEEVERLVRFLKKGAVDLLQLRNLSIDPHFFLQSMPRPQKGSLGIFQMISILKRRCPGIRLGYFNLSKDML